MRPERSHPIIYAVLEGFALSQHWKSRDYFPLRTSRPGDGDGETGGGVTIS